MTAKSSHCRAFQGITMNIGNWVDHIFACWLRKPIGVHDAQKRLSLSLNLQCFSSPFYSKLGLGKLHVSSSHHKKRLAVESRHHGRPDDSHMFVIKLPPNPYYYTNNGPVPAPNAIEDVGKKVGNTKPLECALTYSMKGKIPIDRRDAQVNP